MITLLGSSCESLVVATVTVAVRAPAAIVTCVGGVPLIIAPLSVMDSLTVSAVAGARSLATVKLALSPSSIGDAPPVIVTTGTLDTVVRMVLLLHSEEPRQPRARTRSV